VHAYEEVDSLFAVAAVHHVNNLDVFGERGQAGFFAGLAEGGFDHSFAWLKVSGNHAEIAVHVAGVGAAGEQHLLILDHE
jgi:hypothetical protein